MENHGKRYTLEGKSAGGKFNALAHGLRAASLLLPDESAISFGKLAGRLHREFRPEGPVELLLVAHLVATVWRLRRCEALEVGVFEYYGQKRSPTDDDRPAMRLGRAFVRDHPADAFSKLNRYRVSAEKQLLRLLRQLGECQARRRSTEQTGEAVARRSAHLPPPSAGGNARGSTADKSQ